ncbi:hypothetical protein AD27_1173 [Escherichia coli 2-177-06_S4_C3]|nr:hypothetical protein AD27_1173 [Escherichia coli 2-177-06_S4_C3]
MESLTGRFEGLPRIKCRRGGVFGGPDIIDFTYQSFNHIPKKSFRTCGDARKGQAAVLSSQGCRDLTCPPYRWELLSIDAFARCFCFMTGPAQTLQVTVCIRATMSFRNDVVHSSGFNGSPIAQAVLTQMIITLQYARTYGIPFRAIATLVAAQSALMLYPSFATMFIAVTRTVCGCTCTSTLTAGAWDSWGHMYSNEEATDIASSIHSETIFIYPVMNSL